MNKIRVVFGSVIAAALILSLVVSALTTLINDDMSAQGGGGLWLLPNEARAKLENDARAKRLAIENEQAKNEVQAAARKAQIALDENAALAPYRVAGSVLIWLVIISGVAGCVTALVVSLNRRASEVHADASGLYPLLRLRVAGAVVVHDPNKSLTADTIYAPQQIASSIAVIPVQSQASPSQLRMALAGALLQITAAENKHKPLSTTRNKTATKQMLLASEAPPQLEAPQVEVETPLPSDVQLDRLLPGNVTLDALTIGLSNDGPVVVSLSELMHTLVVGASGWGKSTWLRSLLYQLAITRDSVHVVAVDISGSEFNVLDGWGKLLYPVAHTTDEACAVLSAVSEEIARRRELFAQHPLAGDLAEYNRITGDNLPPVICLIDEGTTLLNQSGVGDKLRDAVQTSRQYGVYEVVSGQSVKASVMDTQIRDNFSSKLCFRVSPASSRVVLEGDSRASDLSVKGRAWVQLPGRELVEVQAGDITRDRLHAALTNSGPINGAIPLLPEYIAEDETRRDILDLAAQGLEPSAIAAAVYGYKNGRTVARVREIIDG